MQKRLFTFLTNVSSRMMAQQRHNFYLILKTKGGTSPTIKRPPEEIAGWKRVMALFKDMPCHIHRILVFHETTTATATTERENRVKKKNNNKDVRQHEQHHLIPLFQREFLPLLETVYGKDFCQRNVDVRFDERDFCSCLVEHGIISSSNNNYDVDDADDEQQSSLLLSLLPNSTTRGPTRNDSPAAAAGDSSSFEEQDLIVVEEKIRSKLNNNNNLNNIVDEDNEGDNIIRRRVHETLLSLPDNEQYQKDSYLKAYQRSPYLIQTESDPLQYFNTVAAGDDLNSGNSKSSSLIIGKTSSNDSESIFLAAAVRLAVYWEKREELFQEKASLPITDFSLPPSSKATALTEEDLEVIKSGTYAILSSDPAAGKMENYHHHHPVLCISRARLPRKLWKSKSRMRALFAMFTKIAMDAAVVAKRKPRFSILREMQESLPLMFRQQFQIFADIRDTLSCSVYKDIHCGLSCMKRGIVPMLKETVEPLLMECYGKKWEGRLTFCYDVDSFQSAIKEIGIGLDGVPKIFGGSWSYEVFDKWFLGQQQQSHRDPSSSKFKFDHPHPSEPRTSDKNGPITDHLRFQEENQPAPPPHKRIRRDHSAAESIMFDTTTSSSSKDNRAESGGENGEKYHLKLKTDKNAISFRRILNFHSEDFSQGILETQTSLSEGFCRGRIENQTDVIEEAKRSNISSSQSITATRTENEVSTLPKEAKNSTQFDSSSIKDGNMYVKGVNADNTLNDNIIRHVHEAVLALPDEQKGSYLKAHQRCPNLISAESSPIQYFKCYYSTDKNLSSLKLDTISAETPGRIRQVSDYSDAIHLSAVRLAFYWKNRELFFEEKAFLPITDFSLSGEATGLTEDDVAVIKSGNFAIIPPDKHNRPVLFVSRTRCPPSLLKSKCRIRAFFVVMTKITMEAAAAGQTCITLIREMAEQFPSNFHQIMKLFIYTINSIACNVIKQVNVGVSLKKQAVRMMKQTIEQPVLNNTELYGTQWEGDNIFCYDMQAFVSCINDIGIGLDGIPTNLGGSWSYENHDRWFLEEANRERRALLPGSSLQPKEDKQDSVEKGQVRDGGTGVMNLAPKVLNHNILCVAEKLKDNKQEEEKKRKYDSLTAIEKERQSESESSKRSCTNTEATLRCGLSDETFARLEIKRSSSPRSSSKTDVLSSGQESMSISLNNMVAGVTSPSSYYNRAGKRESSEISRQKNAARIRNKKASDYYTEDETIKAIDVHVSNNRNNTILRHVHEAALALPDEQNDSYVRAFESSPLLIRKESNPIQYFKCFYRSGANDTESASFGLIPKSLTSPGIIRQTSNYSNAIFLAAVRLAFYWKKREELFQDKAFLPISDFYLPPGSKATALTKEDLEVIRSGTYAILPAGITTPAIFLISRTRLPPTSWKSKSRMRALFVMFTKIARDAAVARQTSFIILREMQESLPAMFRQEFQTFVDIRDSLPCDVDKEIYFGVPSTKRGIIPMLKKTVEPLLTDCYGKDWEGRVRFCYDMDSFQSSTKEVGLSMESVPQIFGGSWTYEVFDKWFLEQGRNPSKSDLSKSDICPTESFQEDSQAPQKRRKRYSGPESKTLDTTSNSVECEKGSHRDSPTAKCKFFVDDSTSLHAKSKKERDRFSRYSGRDSWFPPNHDNDVALDECENTCAEVPQAEEIHAPMSSFSKLENDSINRIKSSILRFPDDMKMGYAAALSGNVILDSDIFAFLTCEDQNETAAARRLALYWNTRFELFGDRALAPISLDGEGILLRQDLLTLQSGAFLVLQRDKMGNSIFCFDLRRMCGAGVSDEVLKRVAFYMLSVACECSKTNEIVILYPLDPSDSDLLGKEHLFTDFLRIVPVKIATVQIIILQNAETRVPDKKINALCSSFLPVMRKKEENLYVHHGICREKILSLLELHHGITRYTLPSWIGGDWSFDDFATWIELRLRLEWKIPPGATHRGKDHIFDFSKIILPAKLSDQERKIYNRRMNVLHTRRKREKERVEIEKLNDTCRDLRGRNQDAHLERARLQDLLAKAHQVVANCAAASSSSSSSQSQQQQQPKNYSLLTPVATTEQNISLFPPHEEGIPDSSLTTKSPAVNFKNAPQVRNRIVLVPVLVQAPDSVIGATTTAKQPLSTRLKIGLSSLSSTNEASLLSIRNQQQTHNRASESINHFHHHQELEANLHMNIATARNQPLGLQKQKSSNSISNNDDITIKHN